ncbi:unnamed protein product [Sphagnum troendelagicum]|uniref:adenylate kinase n=1 Tax=Sphagnum troendelagicum TaxID=128251 RepID=A0ABP0U2Q2_9BRYO
MASSSSLTAMSSLIVPSAASATALLPHSSESSIRLTAPVFPSLATLLRLSNKSVIRRRFPVVAMTSSRGSQATKPADNLYQQALAGKEPLRIMISGAPASGKGTQCELIVAKYGLTHISAGDLLRAEVAAGTDAGNKAQEYMQEGKLVPNEIVVMMVKNALLQAVDQSGGWLLDGYPRSLSQAEALDALGIRPQLFILLDVPDEILVQRSVGRRYDPVTGKIYHLIYAPPETPEIAARLTQRLDDTEEKVKLRLQTHEANVAAVIGSYKDVIKHVDGNRPKAEVFAEIDKLLLELQEGETEEVGATIAARSL